jgi:hypothetical protein
MYRTKQGQTWDEIAKEVYGDEMQVGFLMINNIKLLDTFVFNSEIEVYTPELLEAQRIELPPWR